MKPLIDNKVVCLAVGGIITGLSYLFMQFYLSWFCLIPLFFVLDRSGPKHSFLYGLFYGILTSLILFNWVIPVASRYSGTFTFCSLLFYAAAVIYFSLYFALFGLGYSYICRHSGSTILSGISASGLFVLLEMIRLNLLPGLPWFHYNLAVTQAQNKWAIQWASLGGFYIITFAIVFFNFLLAQYIIKSEIKVLKTAAAVIVIFFAGGFLLSNPDNGGEDKFSGNKFNAVILNENIPAETRWNDLTGDSLAHVFFRLNEQAARSDPDIIIWSETAVPWRFEPDDEFIPRVLSITYRRKADHLLGILSPSFRDKRLVYNSAYLIKNDGRITDRYDKTILLDFLERPLSSSLPLLPFINVSRYDNILPGRGQNVISSGKAHIGVMICNESLSENIYSNYVREGADLLILMSNDSWFENTMLQKHHFYITRLFSVMTGRDIIVNSNRGIIGLIRANGDIEILPHSNTARIFNCEAHLQSENTFYSEINNLIFPFYLFLTVFPLFKRRH